MIYVKFIIAKIYHYLTCREFRIISWWNVYSFRQQTAKFKYTKTKAWPTTLHIQLFRLSGAFRFHGASSVTENIILKPTVNSNNHITIHNHHVRETNFGWGGMKSVRNKRYCRCAVQPRFLSQVTCHNIIIHIGHHVIDIVIFSTTWRIKCQPSYNNRFGSSSYFLLFRFILV